MFDFLKPKDSGTELTSLKLQSPAKPPANASAPAKTITDATQKMATAFKDSPEQAEIQRRAIELAKSGEHPEMFFFLQTKQMSHEVVGVKPDELPPIAEDWQKRGLDSYIMDLSPKAPVFNAMTPKDSLITHRSEE